MTNISIEKKQCAWIISVIVIIIIEEWKAKGLFEWTVFLILFIIDAQMKYWQWINETCPNAHILSVIKSFHSNHQWSTMLFIFNIFFYWIDKINHKIEVFAHFVNWISWYFSCITQLIKNIRKVLSLSYQSQQAIKLRKIISFEGVEIEIS